MHNFGPRFFGGEKRGYHHGHLKEALLEAARRLVAERGPSGFTLAEAAKLVGVTAAAPYRHFTDRGALIEELARRGFEQFAEKLNAAWDQGRPNPIQALRRMGSAYLEFAREEPGLYSSMFGNVQTLNAPEPGAAADKALDSIRQACATVLEHNGAGRDGAKALAFEMWALSHGLAMLMLSGHLDPVRTGSDPVSILETAATSLVEGAIARHAASKAPKGPWAR
ncbi:TetR/AcrR family transcriptional regulator [Roseiarcaceae bacterium H3SJ34-1]|uniref:TetR/AcrR family transcriptional regulator n=1 Tax=Terripilifer ovatus TaxID=3032367 RepID=UPI003AB92D58|nr:TetR/AcrR family transcriptional regulator [Roseiarcaceae bacterium H3SJ34-1]